MNSVNFKLSLHFSFMKCTLNTIYKLMTVNEQNITCLQMIIFHYFHQSHTQTKFVSKLYDSESLIPKCSWSVDGCNFLTADSSLIRKILFCIVCVWWLTPTGSHRMFVFGATAPSRPELSHSRSFLDHTQRRTTVGRTPLDEWSARCRDLYLTTHNTHNRQTCLRWNSNPKSQQASGHRQKP
jgi:hypothetical protein